MGNILYRKFNVDSPKVSMYSAFYWYYGTNKISPNYEKATYTMALQNYNIKNKDLPVIYTTSIYGK
jgi:hypothetical protein